MFFHGENWNKILSTITNKVIKLNEQQSFLSISFTLIKFYCILRAEWIIKLMHN
jgi:hypothetical protein